MFMANALFSVVALIFYSGRFITEIDNKTKHLAYRADHDMLTGVLNREGFIAEAGNVLESHPDTDYIIVCSDVKDFKMINDIYGDEVGDKVLVRRPSLLQICLSRVLLQEESVMTGLRYACPKPNLMKSSL